MIDFLRYIKIYSLVSISLIVLAVSSLVLWGLNPSVDFTGGTLLEIRPAQNQVSAEQISQNFPVSDNLTLTSVQFSNQSNSFILRLNTIDESTKNILIDELDKKLNVKFETLKFDSVGPTLGRELLVKTLFAVLIAASFIMGYVAYQFKNRYYGISAIISMIHDSVILLGSFAILGYFLNIEVDTLFVTALLTTLSFSVHDTIVVFDRIREKLNKNKGISLYNAINQAISETLPRSLNNSLTIIFMLIVLVILGGITIKWFAVALLIGTIAGTYSSPFIATVLLYRLSQVNFNRIKNNLRLFKSK